MHLNPFKSTQIARSDKCIEDLNDFKVSHYGILLMGKGDSRPNTFWKIVKIDYF